MKPDCRDKAVTAREASLSPVEDTGRPRKRARQESEEEEDEDPFGGQSSQIDEPTEDDESYNPEDSILDITLQR